MARVAGTALIAIGLVCLGTNAHDRAVPPVSLLIGLLTYNSVVPVILVHSAIANSSGVALWLAAVLHLAFAFWIAACIRVQLGARRRLDR